MNSLGIQAVVDRVLGNPGANPASPEIFELCITATDYEFIKEVIDGSCQTLDSVNRLSEAGTLRYCPVRVFLRVITASILLLKALSLGTRGAELEASLAVLDRCVHALKASTLDEMHLAVRYGSLLEAHLSKFRQGMVPSALPRDISSFQGFGGWDSGGLGVLDEDTLDEFSFSASNWLALPLD
ncbi:hypothetical protein CMUS01_02204 [Colletotrichum musicola]|uniref:Uncharacterized protein n=1 Tax=Colletotrichum musicola TaxID=2175873 RepID=A0A8H6U7A7_9PEZI|nr:hypothetical protein CMUS01_02204 [Colletotrichum musicola]